MQRNARCMGRCVQHALQQTCNARCNDNTLLADPSRQRYTATALFIECDRMPFQPGRTKTGGRKPGSQNTRTKQQKAAIAALGVDPVRYMLAIVADESAPEERRDRMAVAVAPYTNPRLAVIDATVKSQSEITVVLSDEQRRERAREAIRAAFSGRPLVIEHEPRVIAGRDVAKDVAQANGEASDEREG